MNSALQIQKDIHIAVIDCGSKKVGELLAIVRDHCPHISHISLDEAGAFDFRSPHGVIISGGPHLFTHPGKGKILRRKFQFISSISVPMLGICLGHQAIGLHFGAHVFKGKENRQPAAVNICAGHPLFEGIPENAAFAEDHCEGITLPPEFKRIAWSGDYSVEAMACDRLRIFGVQFHPEISGTPGRRLIENFLSLIDPGNGSKPFSV